MSNLPVLDPEDVLAKHLGIDVAEIQIWNDGSFTKIYNDRVEYYVLNEEEYLTKMPDSWAHFEAKMDGYYIYKV